MPVLGRANKPAADASKDSNNNPGFRPRGALLSNDDGDDDALQLDDETRKLIMQDLERGRIPTFPSARGSGVQGASYLIGQQQHQQQSATPTNTVATGTSMTSRVSSNNNSSAINLNAGRRTTAPGAAAAAAIPPPPPQAQSSDTKAPARNLNLAAQNSKPSRVAVAAVAAAAAPPSVPEAPEVFAATAPTSLDPELIDVMASRLRFLERQVSFLQSELREKSQKLSTAQNRLSDSEDAVAKLQSERFYLAEKVASMSQFLADYGLSWVGEGDKKEQQQQHQESEKSNNNSNNNGKRKFDLYSGSVNAQKCVETAEKATNESGVHLDDSAASVSTTSNNQNSPSGRIKGSYSLQQPSTHQPRSHHQHHHNNNSSSGSNSPPDRAVHDSKQHQQQQQQIPFDYDSFVANCEELSSKVSQHEFSSDQQQHHRNQQQPGTVVLRPREVVTVVVYADGITVHGGPFRPFGWALCDAFVQDVLDGYFPYEYRARFPEGFPIEVIDKRAHRYLQLDPSIVNGKNKNNNNNIRTLNDSPYSLKKNSSGGTGGGGVPLGGRRLFNDNSSVKDKGRVLGGTRHAGVSAGAEATRELILKRIPTRFVTPSGRIINPAAGIEEFLGVGSKNNASASNNSNNDGAAVTATVPPRPKTPPRTSAIRPFDEEHRAELERLRELEEKAKAARQEYEARAAADREMRKQQQQQQESSAAGKNSKNNSKRNIRVVFPSGEHCDVVIERSATLQQLHDAIEAVAGPSLMLPPVDLRNEAAVLEMAAAAVAAPPSVINKDDELGMGQRTTSSMSGIAVPRRMELHARFPSRTLMQREQSLDEAGIGARDETVLVKWRRVA